MNAPMHPDRLIAALASAVALAVALGGCAAQTASPTSTPNTATTRAPAASEPPSSPVETTEPEPAATSEPEAPPTEAASPYAEMTGVEIGAYLDGLGIDAAATAQCSQVSGADPAAYSSAAFVPLEDAVAMREGSISTPGWPLDDWMPSEYDYQVLNENGVEQVAVCVSSLGGDLPPFTKTATAYTEYSIFTQVALY